MSRIKRVIANVINYVIAHVVLLNYLKLEGHPLFLAAMTWGFISCAIIFRGAIRE